MFTSLDTWEATKVAENDEFKKTCNLKQLIHDLSAECKSKRVAIIFSFICLYFFDNDFNITPDFI